METRDQRFPPFADDIGGPLSNLPLFLDELQRILKKAGTTAVIYGHVGEGNLHIRPLITKENWAEQLRKLSDSIFKAALSFDGTISAEHGLGRNRSKYLREEWGDKMYRYFQEVKNIFDPEGILNPGIVFTEDDLTKNLKI